MLAAELKVSSREFLFRVRWDVYECVSRSSYKTVPRLGSVERRVIRNCPGCPLWKLCKWLSFFYRKPKHSVTVKLWTNLHKMRLTATTLTFRLNFSPSRIPIRRCSCCRTENCISRLTKSIWVSWAQRIFTSPLFCFFKFFIFCCSSIKNH